MFLDSLCEYSVHLFLSDLFYLAQRPQDPSMLSEEAEFQFSMSELFIYNIYIFIFIIYTYICTYIHTCEGGLKNTPFIYEKYVFILTRLNFRLLQSVLSI